MDRLLSTPTLAQRWIPVIPSEFQVYEYVSHPIHFVLHVLYLTFMFCSSYAIDPKWQMKLVAIYASFLGFTTLISMPFIYRTIRNGRYYSGLAIVEYPDEPTPRQSPPTDHFHLRPSTRFAPVRRVGKTICAVWQSVTLYTLPLPNIKFWSHQVGDCCRRAYFSLGLAQTGLVLAYICTVVACFVTGAQLVENSNRAGKSPNQPPHHTIPHVSPRLHLTDIHRQASLHWLNSHSSSSSLSNPLYQSHSSSLRSLTNITTLCTVGSVGHYGFA